MNLQTVFEFTLLRGYADDQGNLHRKGVMRLATAMDEIAPLRDPRVQSNEAYLSILLLARVITNLGTITQLNSGIIERLFTVDMAYLQEFYRRINQIGHLMQPVSCPSCDSGFEVEYQPDGMNEAGNFVQPVACPSCDHSFKVEYAPVGGEV